MDFPPAHALSYWPLRYNNSAQFFALSVLQGLNYSNNGRATITFVVNTTCGYSGTPYIAPAVACQIGVYLSGLPPSSVSNATCQSMAAVQTTNTIDPYQYYCGGYGSGGVWVSSVGGSEAVGYCSSYGGGSQVQPLLKGLGLTGCSISYTVRLFLLSRPSLLTRPHF